MKTRINPVRILVNRGLAGAVIFRRNLKFPPFLLFRFCIISIGCLVLCHSRAAEITEAKATNQSTTCLGESAVFPLVVPGDSVNGVEYSFLITNYVAVKGRLEGSLLLNNNTEQGQKFYHYYAFAFYLRVRKMNGPELRRLVFVTPDGQEFGIKPMPEGNKVDVKAHGKLAIPFQITIPSWFDIEPNVKYEASIEFDYDRIKRPFPKQNLFCFIYRGEKWVYDLYYNPKEF